MPYTIAQDLQVNGAGTFTGNVSAPAGTTDSHVINKLQFDTAINDIRNRDDSKPSVKATYGTTGGIPGIPSGDLITDTGVSVTTGDRVLLAFSGDQVNNGPWIVGATWIRADDGAISNQSNWRVEQGTDSGVAYVVTTPGTIILGTTPFTIVPIAAAASLVADSLGSTEIVDDEIRVNLDTGANVQLAVDTDGLSIDQALLYDYLLTVTPNLNKIHAVSRTNVDISSLTPPASVDGVAISYSGLNSLGNPQGGSRHILLTNQTSPSENGLYVAYNNGVNNALRRTSREGVYVVALGTLCKGETWFIGNTGLARISAPTHFQTIVAGIAATHTVTHNKNTLRPQVKLFDTVTNEELFAQPSNITLNAYDLVLSALTNDIEVITNITGDARFSEGA